jgi:type VI secretion system protein ImpL
MTRTMKILLTTASSYLLYFVGAWTLAASLKLQGRPRWILLIGLWVLGFIAAVTIAWFIRKRSPEPPASTEGDEIDATVAAAKARLASAKLGGSSGLGALPMVLVMGPEGSAKTTSVVRSGLESDLLAGEVFRGEATASTRAVNLWYAENTVFLEAGGKVAENDVRWERVVRHMQPQRLAAVLGRGTQSPRVAVVCYSCEEFLKPGSGEAVPAAARALRARLGEVSQGLGIRLPVYVLFTKADRVPHFADYVQNFSADDAQEVLGATLRPDLESAPGSYADRETQQLAESFQQIFLSLAERRLLYLARENASERKPGAYEFPREFRKISPLAVQFLVELCKPSQLQVSPFLRGFYFTGVQAIIVNEMAPGAAAQPLVAAAAGAAGATGVFQAGGLRTAVPAAPPLTPVTRKVPRWVFLPRVFRDVILADGAAMGVTGGGARVNYLRRLGLAAAAVLAFFLAVGFTTSYAGNRSLQRGTVEAARGMGPVAASGPELPPIDALQRLDSLRARVQTLSEYEHDGAPVRLRFGLYSGSALYPEARRMYFDAFHKLLFGATHTSLLAALRGLPDVPRPGDDYGHTYDLLKTHLITTSHPDKSTAEFVAPVLLGAWLDGRQLDADRTQLAQRQFEFYGSELPYGNPFPEEADAAAVTRGRAFLQQFAGSERIYQTMLSEAGQQNPPVQFNRKYPGSAASVADSYEVPGAFTKGGWAFMQAAFKNIDRFFQGESWVLGPQTGPPPDRTKLLAELRTRYQSDYLNHWRTFLRSASVVRYGNVRDAAQKLTALSSTQSPLLSLFAITAQNTTVDSTTAAAFQPVHAVTPPAVTDKLIGGPNQGYVNALVALQSSLEQVANAPTNPPEAAAAAVGVASTNAATAKVAARQLAQSFRLDPEGRIEATVQKLMEDPITNAEPMLRNFGSGELNAKGQRLCGPYRGVLSRYPFNSASSTQASIAEVTDFFRPATGALWRFYNDGIQNVLIKQGSEYVPKPGGTVTLSPSFVSFFNRAAAFSDALFKEGSPEPRFAFILKPLLSEATSTVTIVVDGQVVKSTRNALESGQLVWPGTAAKEAKIYAQVGGQEVSLLGFQGPWALFQLFQATDSWQPSGGQQRVEWTVRKPDGTPLKIAAELNLGGAAPILRKGYFGGFNCSGNVAQ